MSLKALKALVILTAVIAGPAVTSGIVAAQTPAPSDFEALAARLETAVLAEDATGVKAARIGLLRQLPTASDPARVALLRYTAAYAGWRLAFASALPAGEKQDLLDDAETQLKETIKLAPGFAEAPALLSAVYGAKIAQAPDLGMTLGMQASAMLAKAVALGPDNPRVLVLKALSLFHTPPEYGGSVRDAEAVFRQALTRFDQEGARTRWPTWGRFDAHVWLGQALAARGDKAGARSEYEKALAIAPGSNWVKLSLLPQVR